MFFRGQKVVCINSVGWLTMLGSAEGPKFGEVCTIRDMFVYDDREALVLHGYNCMIAGQEMGYAITQFRPVTEKGTETGMAILRQIAQTGKMPKRVKKSEDA